MGHGTYIKWTNLEELAQKNINKEPIMWYTLAGIIYQSSGSIVLFTLLLV